MEIEYVDLGLANNYGDHIEINKNLKKYPLLLKYVIAHERTHERGFDLDHEFDFSLIIVLKLILFCFKYPKTLIDLLPIRMKNKVLYYDFNLICLYCLLLFLLIILIIF